MDEVLLLIPLVIVLVVVVRVMAGGLDHERVKKYVEGRGGRVLEAKWEPFGPGWLGEKSDRIYAVRYLDRDGNEHRAHCKTSLWTGVYFTEDQLVATSEHGEPQESSLDAENRRLRAELDQLKRQQGGSGPG